MKFITNFNYKGKYNINNSKKFCDFFAENEMAFLAQLLPYFMLLIILGA